MRYILLGIIWLYQKTLSLDHGLLGKLLPNTRYCRFTPSCSQYSFDAVKKYGVIKGLWLSVKRLSRCNLNTPMGMYDPVN